MRYLIIGGLCDGKYSMFIHYASYSAAYVKGVGDDSLPHPIFYYKDTGGSSEEIQPTPTPTNVCFWRHHASACISSRTQADNNILICEANQMPQTVQQLPNKSPSLHKHIWLFSVRSEGEHRCGVFKIFQFTRNKEELCVEGNSEGHSTGRRTNLERSHVWVYAYTNLCAWVFYKWLQIH